MLLCAWLHIRNISSDKMAGQIPPHPFRLGSEMYVGDKYTSKVTVRG